jgi:hypothetical protein
LKSPVGFGGRKKVTAQSIVVGFYGVTNTARFVRFSFPAAIRSAMWTVDAAGAVTVTDCFIVRYQTNVQQQNNTNSLESYTTKCHLCSLFLLTLDWAGIQQYIYIDGDCDTILRLAVMWFKRIETARS